jgi:hypothetical protein
MFFCRIAAQHPEPTWIRKGKAALDVGQPFEEAREQLESPRVLKKPL